ncbi:MAG: ROK family protein [Acidobacteria bacterium]|nr:MAG: ROK family protein [Acidobacteriota bacterium]REK01859.1 MAG: ROK family protein [Acidobacteriota bacterium]REK14815.1 MAG: ROK family protein [Acidobacteriota bacterium]REK45530.1 MAG: ROK family protein [Acidobacteriota bacterium]
MTDIVLATDLGGTNMRMAAVSRSGEILYRTKESTPRSHDGDAIIEAIVRMGTECRDNLVGESLVAVAVAFPGAINSDTGKISKAPNLPELEGVTMSEVIKGHLGMEVIFENDANAAAIGEHWLGASQGVDNSIMVTLGTGVGGGLILNGEILRGPDGTAGEIGHINVEAEGVPCGCGSRGCVEQYSSASAVVRIAQELAAINPESELNKQRDLTAEDAYRIAMKGDKTASEVFRIQGYYLGIMLGGLVNTLNPEIIVIGGGAAASWELFYPPLMKEIKARCYKEPAERVKITRSELGDDAGILGGAKLGFKSVGHSYAT